MAALELLAALELMDAALEEEARVESILRECAGNEKPL